MVIMLTQIRGGFLIAAFLCSFVPAGLLINVQDPEECDARGDAQWAFAGLIKQYQYMQILV